MSYLIGCTLTLFLSTLLTRAFPFVFIEKVKDVKQIKEVGKYLPACIMVLLCMQCLGEVKYFSYPYGIPEILASISVVLVHFAKRNALLSILLGTIIFGVSQRLFNWVS